MYKYRIIAIAGTFDRLHKGHRFFISQAFKLGRKVIIGLTSDKYVKDKFRIKNIELRIEGDQDTSDGGPKGLLRGGGISKITEVEEFAKRKETLVNFLREEESLDKAQIVSIDDIYGPAIEKNQIEALVVTSETLTGAKLVNRKRKELGLPPLKIVKISLVLAEDKKRIASTRIKLGEIDRWGRAFAKQFTNYQLPITNELRQQLKKPLGMLIKGDPIDLKKVTPELKRVIRKLQPVMLITCGDEVTKLCNEIGMEVNLAIIDFKVGRRKIYHTLFDLGFTNTGKDKNLPNSTGVKSGKNIFSAINPAGHITKRLVEAVRKAFRNFIRSGDQQIIKVIGEEDLAGIPAILLSPLGSVVLYGQPQEGVVVVAVDELNKQYLLDLLR